VKVEESRWLMEGGEEAWFHGGEYTRVIEHAGYPGTSATAMGYTD
jgi:hypothetical protein